MQLPIDRPRRLLCYIFTSWHPNHAILTWTSDSSCQTVYIYIYIDSWKCLESGFWVIVWGNTCFYICFINLIMGITKNIIGKSKEIRICSYAFLVFPYMFKDFPSKQTFQRSVHWGITALRVAWSASALALTRRQPTDHTSLTGHWKANRAKKIIGGVHDRQIVLTDFTHICFHVVKSIVVETNMCKIS